MSLVECLFRNSKFKF